MNFPEIEQAFKQFTLECLDLAIADDNGNVVEKGSPALIPWDDPYPVFSGVSLEDEEDATDVKKPDESAGKLQILSVLTNVWHSYHTWHIVI